MREVQLSEIARCKSKDSKLVGQIFLRLHPSLISLCYRYLGSFSDSEDVVMISWVKILERLSDFQYEHPLSFYAWIKKICINESLGILRKRNNFHLISLSDLPEESQPHFNEFSSIDTQTLLTLVAQLPDGYRTVFNLFAIEGYSHAEISQLLQISESTSKSQLRKARLSLAQSIKSTFNESAQSNHNHDNTQGI
jgi:RNA polymerase sigma-70 factor (ECF subfamily)